MKLIEAIDICNSMNPSLHKAPIYTVIKDNLVSNSPFDYRELNIGDVIGFGKSIEDGMLCEEYMEYIPADPSERYIKPEYGDLISINIHESRYISRSTKRGDTKARITRITHNPDDTHCTRYTAAYNRGSKVIFFTFTKGMDQPISNYNQPD